MEDPLYPAAIGRQRVGKNPESQRQTLPPIASASVLNLANVVK